MGPYKVVKLNLLCNRSLSDIHKCTNSVDTTGLPNKSALPLPGNSRSTKTADAAALWRKLEELLSWKKEWNLAKTSITTFGIVWVIKSIGPVVRISDTSVFLKLLTRQKERAVEKELFWVFFGFSVVIHYRTILYLYIAKQLLEQCCSKKKWKPAILRLIDNLFLTYFTWN